MEISKTGKMLSLSLIILLTIALLLTGVFIVYHLVKGGLNLFLGIMFASLWSVLFMLVKSSIEDYRKDK